MSETRLLLASDVYEALVQVREARVPAVLATVVESLGSAPQDAGAKLLVVSALVIDPARSRASTSARSPEPRSRG